MEHVTTRKEIYRSAWVILAMVFMTLLSRYAFAAQEVVVEVTQLRIDDPEHQAESPKGYPYLDFIPPTDPLGDGHWDVGWHQYGMNFSVDDTPGATVSPASGSRVGVCAQATPVDTSESDCFRLINPPADTWKAVVTVPDDADELRLQIQAVVFPRDGLDQVMDIAPGNQPMGSEDRGVKLVIDLQTQKWRIELDPRGEVSPTDSDSNVSQTSRAGDLLLNGGIDFAISFDSPPCSIGSPCNKVEICTVWNANFIDTGFGEDVASDDKRQQLPAAFAQFSLLRDGLQVDMGNLDGNGCLDATDTVLDSNGVFANPSASWLLETTSVMTKEIAGRSLVIRVQERSGTVPPMMKPETDPPDQPLTVRTPFNISDGGITNVLPTTRNNVTAVAGFASELLSRDNDEMGLRPATLTVYAGQGCPDTIDTGCRKTTETTESCVSSCPELFIGPRFTQGGTCPANIGLGDAHWKYVIAHEFGHLIQRTFGVVNNPKYIPKIAGSPAQCRCDHVTVANKWHCMQDMLRPHDAQGEGFAHFYSANVWNSPGSTSCAFAYYKEFLVRDEPNLPPNAFQFVTVPPEDPAPPLTASCSMGTALPPGDAGAPNSLYSILPPMRVDCFGVDNSGDPTEFINYRKQADCWPAGGAMPDAGAPDAGGSGITIADLSTEFDWMKFYMNLTRNPDPTEAVSMTELLELYASFCTSSSSCGVGGKDAKWDELFVAARAQLSGTQALAFDRFANTHGVDRNR